MITTASEVSSSQLSLPEELTLMLLNEESGYFHLVPGWNLNCAFVGAVLAELSLLGNIDTDMQSLHVLDSEPVGDPLLDHILEIVSADVDGHDAQYWVEYLAPHAEAIINLALERLVASDLVRHHEGDFWTLAPRVWRSEHHPGGSSETAAAFVKGRITSVIFDEEIPDPRDVITISLLNACDVLRFIFQLEPEAEQRIELILKMDVIGRAISEAVANNLASPLAPSSVLSRSIPKVKLTRLPFNRHARAGNLPALLADLSRQYGPVFKFQPPFQKPLTFLVGPEVNRWAQREGRTYLTSTKYLDGLENVYGAHGIIPALDSGDHFRMRKAMQPSYSRARLVEQLDEVYRRVRLHMAEWKIGESMPARSMARLLTNAQISPIVVSVDSQDIIEDLIEYKERALNTRVAGVLPRFLLHTWSMHQRAKSVGELINRIERTHTPSLRKDQPRDIVDDLLSLHASDPQLLPESSLKFSLSAPLLASMYLGDALGFALHSLATQPDLYERVGAEADGIFAEGDPEAEVFSGPDTDVTRRFVMECLRLFPIVSGSMRDVMNSCSVGGYELPLGARVLIMQTATHFMEEEFPDPFKFDIDRYLPGRDEHRSTSYAPFGLGTHTCLGHRWVELQMAIDLLMVAYYFEIEVGSSKQWPSISPFPSQSLGGKERFVIAGRRRELPV